MSTLSTLNYARSDTGPKVRIGAAAVMMATALGLVGLGGCFLIGVMMLVTGLNGSPAVPIFSSAGAYGLMAVLYILAFACFAAAAILIVLGLGYLRPLRTAERNSDR